MTDFAMDLSVNTNEASERTIIIHSTHNNLFENSGPISSE
jgi:hypothetical protein